MQVYDKVKVLKDRDEYKKYNVYKGMVGTIICGEIRDNSFHVCFIDPRFYDENFVWTDENMKTMQEDNFCTIKIEDLDPKWWCKVEDGYILNLLGEKKNKIPYDYNS